MSSLISFINDSLLKVYRGSPANRHNFWNYFEAHFETNFKTLGCIYWCINFPKTEDELAITESGFSSNRKLPQSEHWIPIANRSNQTNGFEGLEWVKFTIFTFYHWNISITLLNYMNLGPKFYFKLNLRVKQLKN